MSRIEALNVIPFGSLSTATNPAPETVGSPCPPSHCRFARLDGELESLIGGTAVEI